MKQITRVAQIGLGALGSFTAPYLQKALGSQFMVLAKGARKERLSQNGMVVNGQQCFFNVVDPDSCTEPADLIFLVVKSAQLPQALEDIRPLVGEHTILLPLLNGIESEEITASVYGWERTLYALCRVSVLLQGNQAVFNPNNAVLRFGERQNNILSDRVKAVKELLEKTEISFEIPEDMLRAQWLKFMYNISQNQSSAILGIPFDAWVKSEHANAIRETAMWEVIRVAQAEGIDLREADIVEHRSYFAKVSPQSKTSMLQDLEAGRHTEVDQLAGALIPLAQKHGIPVPCNELFYHSIKVLEEKQDGLF